VIQSGVPRLNYEEPRVSRDGREAWLRTSKVPLLGSAGDVLGVLGVYEDITSRKEVETALRDNQAKLELALRAANMGIWEWRITTNELIWSERVAEIFGLHLADFSGDFEAYRVRIHPDDLAMVTARINESVQGGVADYHVEHRILLPNGVFRWIEARGRVFRDAGGRPERMGGLVWDVTERKISEGNLLRIAQGIGGLSGRALVESVLATLSSVTHADYAFIGRLADGNSIQTEAVLVNGQPAENMRYDLADTPCARVLEQEVCVYPANVQQLFPRDDLLRQMGVEAYVGVPLCETSGRPSGLLVVLFRRPISRAEEIQSIVSILAAAVAADYERSRAVAALKQANAELEERVRARTDELQRLVNLMAGREIRMAELKSELRRLQTSGTASSPYP
jgi:PAS domain S-box-containing protein